MKSEVKVSVVVVVYNGKEYIEECIDSVLASEGVDEIVVVDNCSVDGSWQLLEKRYDKEERVRLFRAEENLLFAGGSNWGAEKARGEWIVFLNSDTKVEKDWIREMLQVAREKEKRLVQPKILQWGSKIIDNVGGDFIWPGLGGGRGKGERAGKYENNRKIDFANGTCFLIEREFFKKLGGFDEWFGFFYEDVDLNLRAKKRGGKAWLAGESVIEHKGGQSFADNVVSDKVLFYSRRNRLVNVMKNFKGIDKWLRVLAILGSYLWLERREVSRRAAREAFGWWFSWWFNWVRVEEVVGKIGGEDFSWLDLGSGEGGLLRVVKERGIRVEGYDKKQGDLIEELELEDKFGVVSMYHVLEHVDRPGQVMQRVKKWIKKDGWLVIEVPLVGNWSEKWLGEEYLAYENEGHKHFFSKKKVEELFEKSGYQVIDKGRVSHQLPFHLIRAGFKQGWMRGLISVLLWLPFKLAVVVGVNEEMARYYLKRQD